MKKRQCRFCDVFFFWQPGQGKGIYCSRRCSCKSHHTKDFQSKAGKAGKAGGATKIPLRGTGTKTYIKEFGRHQHRVVMERHLGRKLKSNEIVHHIDKNKHNNDLKNLMVMTQSEHCALHLKERYAFSL